MASSAAAMPKTMKSSIRRRSLGLTVLFGLNKPSASPRGTCPPIFAGISETSRGPDGGNAAIAPDNPFPVGFHPVTQRGDHAQASNDDPPHGTSLKYLRR